MSKKVIRDKIKFKFITSGYKEISEVIDKVSYHLKEIEKLEKSLSKMSIDFDIIEFKD